LKLPVSVEIACEVEIACVKLKLPVSHTLFFSPFEKRDAKPPKENCYCYHNNESFIRSDNFFISNSLKK